MSEARAAWVQRVLGITLPAHPTAAPGTPGDRESLAATRAALAALLPRLKDLLAALPDQAAEIRLRAAQATAAVKAADTAGAAAHIAWLSALRAPAPSADPRAAAPAKSWRDAYAAWQDAKDTIDGQLNALSAHLRRTNDKEMIAIADHGLLRMTNDCFVPARAAFMDFGMARPADRPKLAREAMRRAAALRSQIEADERVAVCEDNPFGVAVTIRKSLIGALDGIVATLEQSAA